MAQKLSLVLGGASSGKSKFAEDLVFKSKKPRTYLATSQIWDSEMETKVAQHKTQRGADWTTIEEPLDIAPALRNLAHDHIALLDCATMWLSNHLLAEHDLGFQMKGLLTALRNCPGEVVVVSNEVGLSVVPDNALARQFRDTQGQLNQAIAAQADLVVAVMAGLPMVLKGSIE